MKPIRLSGSRPQLLLATVLTLSFGLFMVAAAGAQAGVTATPTQLTVAEMRGTTATRLLVLRATDLITDVQVIPLDLVRTDNAAVLPASTIQAVLPSNQIAAGGLLTVPVTLDLRSIPSGQFSGDLLINYSGGSLTVPMTVTVKDKWPLPLIVLIVGVGLGIGVSVYRSQGRPRDAALVRVGQLRAQLQADADMGEPFRSRIEAGLVDVAAALQAENWETAQQALTQAETLLTKWQKGRTDWIAQLSHHAKLVKRLEILNKESAYLQTVRRALEDMARDAPELGAPDQLQKQLDDLTQEINNYLQLRTSLQQLDVLRNRLPPTQAAPWQRKVASLQRRLEELSPSDATAYANLQSEMDQALAELAQLAEQAQTDETAKGLVSFGEPAQAELVDLPPTARPLNLEKSADAARTRLRWFTWISYLIAVLLLAGAGFGELYVARPTFGANVWGDYFALLAWGFGAEATRAAVTEMVRGWGLPGLR